MRDVLNRLPVSMDCEIFEGKAVTTDKLIYDADNRLNKGDSGR